MMTERDLLVQRFLDQELSAEERMDLLVQLGRDAELRQQLLALERLALDAKRLPRPALSDSFLDRVMERAAVARQAPAVSRESIRQPALAVGQPVATGIWSRVTRAVWTSRTFEWDLASAAAGFCLALTLVGLAAGARLLRDPAPSASGAISTDSPATAGATIVESGPGRTSPVLVRLVVVQPGARMVHVVGDFNGWNPARTPLEEVSSGAWAVTIPLEPGRYEYMFVVNGQQWVADPFAPEQIDDGFGSRNAVLEVRPAAGSPL